MKTSLAIDGPLSSDLALADFLATRKAWRVRREDPTLEWRTTEQMRIAAYDTETERLRTQMRLQAMADRLELERKEAS